MKPENSDVQDQLEDDLRPEYDLATLLKGGVRGKYAAAFARGTNLVLLAPDVARAFLKGETVKEGMRFVMRLAELPGSAGPR